MKSFIACLLSLLLLLSCTFSQALELPSQLSEYLFPEDEAAFSTTLTVNQLYPYGQEMLDALQRLLPHLSIAAELKSASTRFAFLVDGNQAAEFSVGYQEDGSVLTTELLENRTLVSRGDVLSALFPSEDENTHSFSLLDATAEADGVYPEIEQAIAAYAEDKTANYTIKGIGKAKWVRLARLTKEQSAELHDLLCKQLICGFNEEDASVINNCTFLKALTVAIYYTKEGGEPISVYIKGNVTHPNGKTFELVYQYSFAEGKLNYKLSLGKDKVDGIYVTASLTDKSTDSALSLNYQVQSSFKSSDGKTAWETSETGKLSGKAGSKTKSLSGEITVKDTVTVEKKASSSTTSYTLDLQAENSSLGGSVQMNYASGKKDLYEIGFTFSPAEAAEGQSEEAASSVQASDNVSIVILDTDPEEAEESEDEPNEKTSQAQSEYLVGTPPLGIETYTAPLRKTQINLDTLSEDSLAELQDELFQNLASKLLLAILTYVPEEDLTLLSDNTNPNAFAKFVSSLSSADEE